MSRLDANSFDFWLGTWDCTFDGGHAVNTVSREFDGAVVVERFAADAPRSWSGMSLSVWDQTGARWRQTWVDQSGNYWHFAGTDVDGDPAFATPDPVDDPALYKRMVFSDIADDSFGWRWESSPDGRTWTVDWRIDYERRGGPI